jgi:hypothetical protein
MSMTTRLEMAPVRIANNPSGMVVRIAVIRSGSVVAA